MPSELDELDTVRGAVVAELETLCPTDWDVKPGQVTPGTTARPTLYVNYHRIEPLSEAPIGQVRVGFELTISTHLTDLSKGEDAVDHQVLELILALDAHPTILWTLAEKILVPATENLAWQITVSTIATTTPEE